MWQTFTKNSVLWVFVFSKDFFELSFLGCHFLIFNFKTWNPRRLLLKGLDQFGRHTYFIFLQNYRLCMKYILNVEYINYVAPITVWDICVWMQMLVNWNIVDGLIAGPNHMCVLLINVRLCVQCVSRDRDTRLEWAECGKWLDIGLKKYCYRIQVVIFLIYPIII